MQDRITHRLRPSEEEQRLESAQVAGLEREDELERAMMLVYSFPPFIRSRAKSPQDPVEVV
jgi:hypothetical protein